jgi:predicted acyltransferase
MCLLETGSSLEAVVLPVSAVASSNGGKSVTRERLVSLDAMRGFAVLGMIVVNTLAYTNGAYGFQPGYAFLAHSPWAGFTFADFVFPAFIFMAGFSVSASLRRARLDWQMLLRIGSRTAGLIALGFLLTNVGWFADPNHGDWRYMGVLQRIGICYFATAVLFATCRPRTRLVVATVVLIAYWPLTLVPLAGHPTYLFVPGANFISFVDRFILGSHTFVRGSGGYDPEGLLSTLPAIAQCVLGALVGEWVLNNRAVARAPWLLAAAGTAMLLLGLAWSPFFPLVKNIWTSSYVLVSTGAAMLLFAFSWWAVDRRRFSFWGLTILEAFGVNALLAYILQGVAQLLPAGADMQAIGAASVTMRIPGLMANFPVVAFLVMLWLPLELMRRRRWIVRL